MPLIKLLMISNNKFTFFMKRTIIALLILMAVFILNNYQANASTIVRSGKIISINEQQTIDGDFYTLGNSVILSGTVAGDFLSIAGNVTINGEVENDVLIIGGAVAIHAPIHGDVRIVAGDVTIADKVDGNIAVLGGRLTILSTASIGGDVLFYGGEVMIDGKVTGKVLGNGDTFTINGVVSNEINVTTRKLSLGEQANIESSIQYIGSTDLVRTPGSIVVGDIIHNDAETKTNSNLPLRTFTITFLISLFTTLSLYLVFRHPLKQFTTNSVKSFSLKILLGFATIFITPIAVSILLVSILGLFVGLIGLFVFLLGLVITIPLINVLVGGLMAKIWLKRYEVNTLTIFIGTLTVQMLFFIPLIGPFVFAVLFLGTLGSVVLIIYQQLLLKQ